MKSPEVYSQLKSVLAPWFKSAGFKRAKGTLGWCHPHGDSHIVIWCQVSQSGWDEYTGSQFTVEFQRSPGPEIGAGGPHTRRERFGFFLSPEEREEVRSIQNEVIAGLQRRPASHPSLHVSQEVTDWYLAKFKPVSEPFTERHDIWLRYASPNHVSRWAHFIAGKLPKCLEVIERWPGTA
jgi:hypothetical protein